MGRLIISVFLLFTLSAFSWDKVDVMPAYTALQTACERVNKADICADIAATKLTPHEFFASHYKLTPLTDSGLLTGYYLPLLDGSYSKSAEYSYPVWAVPDDFHKPYLTRQQIDEGALDNISKPILWVKDKVDLFFLHIQGSGRVRLPDGKIVGLGFAAKNGQPYKSIGKVLIDEGAMAAEGMSMQSLKAWLRANPNQIGRVLWQNPSYIFFELQENAQAVGAQGVALTARGSLAVDPNHIAYGTPVLIETALPDALEESHLLMIAQDTGSAIKSENRADWFLGYGKQAEQLAGKLKQPAKFSVLKYIGAGHE